MGRALAAVAAAVFSLVPLAAAAATPARHLQVRRADDTVIDVEIYDRKSGAPDRALMVIQGSTCQTTNSLKWFDQVVRDAPTRWVVIVDKDAASDTGKCGPAYEAHATEESRWFDHVAAAHRLKAELKLRDKGAFQLLAVSAGGLSACALAGATDDVGAVALISTGGGITFEKELDLLTKGDPKFAAERRRVQTDPRLGRTWLGETNPEIWWWSVLSKRCLPLLDAYRGPIFIGHGTEDTSTPIESARTLVAALKARGLPVTAFELPTGHELGRDTLPPAQSGVGRALAWLKGR